MLDESAPELRGWLALTQRQIEHKIAACALLTYEELEQAAARERAILDRYDRHADRCMRHRVRGLRCGDHDVWPRAMDAEILNDIHVWTLRVLRGARRARARAEGPA